MATRINTRGWRSCISRPAPRGLTVIGVPSRDFNQESADNTTVKTFCEAKFGVEFPDGGDFACARARRRRRSTPGCASRSTWEPNWNFNKVLIGRDGRVVGTFGSGDEPQGKRLAQAIEAELAKD